jgi:putative Holliday junction resolvase
MPAIPESGSLLALDVGEKRIGVAVASLAARLPRPLTTLEQGETMMERLTEILQTEEVRLIIVGLPRNLSGETTAQTESTEVFIEQLRQAISLPIHTQDEALTSKAAEHELNERGEAYQRADIDALAATYILDDFLRDHPNPSEIVA